jgi:hypothetical protein
MEPAPSCGRIGLTGCRRAPSSRGGVTAYLLTDVCWQAVSVRGGWVSTLGSGQFRATGDQDMLGCQYAAGKTPNHARAGPRSWPRSAACLAMVSRTVTTRSDQAWMGE